MSPGTCAYQNCYNAYRDLQCCQGNNGRTVFPPYGMQCLANEGVVVPVSQVIIVGVVGFGIALLCFVAAGVFYTRLQEMQPHMSKLAKLEEELKSRLVI